MKRPQSWILQNLCASKSLSYAKNIKTRLNRAGINDGEGGVGIKVMVIDDSNTIRRTAEALLSKAGYEVLTAADGFEAMSMITDHKPDIIFVDIMMPRLDGYQTCLLIKNNKEF